MENQETFTKEEIKNGLNIWLQKAKEEPMNILTKMLNF